MHIVSFYYITEKMVLVSSVRGTLKAVFPHFVWILILSGSPNILKMVTRIQMQLRKVFIPRRVFLIDAFSLTPDLLFEQLSIWLVESFIRSASIWKPFWACRLQWHGGLEALERNDPKTKAWFTLLFKMQRRLQVCWIRKRRSNPCWRRVGWSRTAQNNL